MTQKAAPEHALIGRVVIRADASLRIGTGHVMRCLTLADALRSLGGDVHFVCRRHQGHLGARIMDRGYDVSLLDTVSNPPQANTLAYADWLGGSQRADAESTANLVRDISPDWLVVDHYAIDERWESELLRSVPRVMVIDDLADRSHRCTLLLDQGLGREDDDYRRLVADDATLLLGPRYALLRPEFVSARPTSLKRRANSPARSVLIAMGGVDGDNVTALVLAALKHVMPPPGGQATVVLGSTALWAAEVREIANSHPWKVDVMVDPPSMAGLMSEADIAIGAAGATTWERCALGVPSVMIPVAANQAPIITQLQAKEAVLLVDGPDDIPASLPRMLECLLHDDGMRRRISENAASLCDGCGVTRVIDEMVRLTATVGGLG